MGLLPSKKLKVVIVIDVEKFQAALDREFPSGGAPKITRETLEAQMKEQWKAETLGLKTSDIGLSLEVTEGRW